MTLAPYSFATPLTMDPSLIGILAGGEKDILLNIRERGGFVVTALTNSWKAEGVRSEAELPRSESEFQAVGLTEEGSERVEAPGVKEAPINLECTFRDELKVADSFLVVGEVVRVAGKQGATKLVE